MARGISLRSKNLLDSPRHGVTQALEVLLGEVGGPQDVDLPDELGQGPGVLALELLLHVVATIFYWVLIQAVSPANQSPQSSGLPISP